MHRSTVQWALCDFDLNRIVPFRLDILGDWLRDSPSFKCFSDVPCLRDWAKPMKLESLEALFTVLLTRVMASQKQPMAKTPSERQSLHFFAY